MILSIAIALAPVCQAPQAQYEEYLKQFDGKPICGTMLARGGPVSQPSGTTFRIAPGGKCHIFSPSWERHSDGNTAYDYFPRDNTYQQMPLSYTDYYLLFGPRYFAQDEPGYVLSRVEDSKFEEQEARIFVFTTKNGDSTQLIVRRRDLRPFGLRQFGNQSAYMLRVVELRTDERFSEASWGWRPPVGAKQRLQADTLRTVPTSASAETTHRG